MENFLNSHRGIGGSYTLKFSSIEKIVNEYFQMINKKELRSKLNGTVYRGKTIIYIIIMQKMNL